MSEKKLDELLREVREIRAGVDVLTGTIKRQVTTRRQRLKCEHSFRELPDDHKARLAGWVYECEKCGQKARE